MCPSPPLFFGIGTWMNMVYKRKFPFTGVVSLSESKDLHLAPAEKEFSRHSRAEMARNCRPDSSDVSSCTGCVLLSFSCFARIGRMQIQTFEGVYSSRPGVLFRGVPPLCLPIPIHTITQQNLRGLSLEAYPSKKQP